MMNVYCTFRNIRWPHASEHSKDTFKEFYTTTHAQKIDDGLDAYKVGSHI